MSRLRTHNRRHKRAEQLMAWVRVHPGRRYTGMSEAVKRYHKRYGAVWFRWKHRNLMGLPQ